MRLLHGVRKTLKSLKSIWWVTSELFPCYNCYVCWHWVMDFLTTNLTIFPRNVLRDLHGSKIGLWNILVIFVPFLDTTFLAVYYILCKQRNCQILQSEGPPRVEVRCQLPVKHHPDLWSQIRCQQLALCWSQCFARLQCSYVPVCVCHTLCQKFSLFYSNASSSFSDWTIWLWLSRMKNDKGSDMFGPSEVH